MAKKMSWLDSVVEQMHAKKEQEQKKTASKKTMSKEEINQRVKKASKIAIKKSLLKKASVGNKVKYNGFMWEVIDTNFKDAAGEGIILKKIAEISSKKVTDPAEYARTDPGDVYDYEVRDSYEVPELNETAANTESRISQENAVDRTTPAGRATNPYTAFTQEVMTEVNEIAEETPTEEAPVVKETPVEESVVEEAADEAPVEEAPVEEAPVEDEGVPAEHDLEEEKEEKEASAEDENEDLQCGTLKDEIVEASRKSLKMHKKAKRENPILASIKGKKTVAKKEVKRENPILASIKSKSKNKE